jgi:hypothetical protein
VTLALRYLRSGRTEEARNRLDALAQRLPTAEEDSEWLPMMDQIAELVSGLGGHPIGAQVYAALLPYAQLYVVEGIGAVLRGPVERPLGLLAAAAGDPATARVHLDRAVERTRELGAPLLLARTLYDAGRSLRDEMRLAEAAEIYRGLGCVHRLAQLTSNGTGEAQPILLAGPTSSAGRARCGSCATAAGRSGFGTRRVCAISLSCSASPDGRCRRLSWQPPPERCQ